MAIPICKHYPEMDGPMNTQRFKNSLNTQVKILAK